MSDPFERLGDLGSAIEPPDPAVIRTRAHSIVRRRRVVMTATAGVAVACLVVVAAVAVPSRGRDGTVAGRIAAGPTPSPLADAPSSIEGYDDLEADEPEPGEGSATGARRPATGGAGSAAGAVSGSGGDAASARREVLEVTVTVTTEAAVGHTFVLEVCNRGEAAVSRSFGSAQRFDLEVFAEGEKEPIWRWSEGRAFAQVIGSETWQAGECRDDWAATWEGRARDGTAAGPGSYEVVGVLAATPAQRSAPEGFCRIGCS